MTTEPNTSMTGGLSALLAQATGTLEHVSGGGIYIASDEDARLIALAPDAISLLIDIAAYLRDNVCDPDCKACAPGHALLARFAELDRRAAE